MQHSPQNPFPYELPPVDLSDQPRSVTSQTDHLIRLLQQDSGALLSFFHLFDLTPFEQFLVRLCWFAEVNPEVRALLSPDLHQQGSPVCLELAVRFYPQPLDIVAHLALAPESTLRAWNLLDMDPRAPLYLAQLRLTERALTHLGGHQGLDHTLSPYLQPFVCPERRSLSSSQQQALQLLTRSWTAPDTETVWQLCQVEPSTVQTLMAQVTQTCGVPGYVLHWADLPQSAAEQWTFWQRLRREVRLTGMVLLIQLETSEPVQASLLARQLNTYPGRVALSVPARQALPELERPLAFLPLQQPTRQEQEALWQVSGLPAESARTLAAEFSLNTWVLQSAAVQALETAQDAAPETLTRIAWDAVRAWRRPRLDQLAQRVQSRATWDDLVLAPPQQEALRAITAGVRHRARIYGDWGFGQAGERGLGLTVLFTGEPGTGKTTAAEILANELHMDLYRVDLSSTVSKYIGETEKQLARLFDAAEGGGVILLFDEADSLFGQRSDTQDARDRYANQEVSYLLQRVEQFQGLAILTTNHEENIDEAFTRRFRFRVEFEFPGRAERRQIWERVFPAQTPQQGLRPERLSRLLLTAAEIREVALNAAVLAADAGTAVTMDHLRQAAHRTYQKLKFSTLLLDRLLDMNEQTYMGAST